MTVYCDDCGNTACICPVPHEPICGRGTASYAMVETAELVRLWDIEAAAVELAQALGPLIAHYRRHTDHRCEIYTDAQAALAEYHALRGEFDG